MNRRTFMASLLAGVVAPAFLPGAGRRWVKQVGSELVTPNQSIANPDYIDAPYEVIYFLSKDAGAMRSYQWLRKEGKEGKLKLQALLPNKWKWEPINLDYPLRFLDEEGKHCVLPFLTAGGVDML